ncbi:uncharacterized protein G2W53_044095 [Senna tora]|uniref:Uncharacterized protein n=1 Tax=Senna tora TaxID=362788 RepID=A0A834SJR2_9FABA|nr:uncharacterized protein G2W53_044095 [Senna tora]
MEAKSRVGQVEVEVMKAWALKVWERIN